VRLRSARGQCVYVEERAGGAGRPTWIVHVDSFAGAPASQHACATVGAVLLCVRRALAVPGVLGPARGRDPHASATATRP
jgi:hypothetical protein